MSEYGEDDAQSGVNPPGFARLVSGEAQERRGEKRRQPEERCNQQTDGFSGKSDPAADASRRAEKAKGKAEDGCDDGRCECSENLLFHLISFRFCLMQDRQGAAR